MRPCGRAVLHNIDIAKQLAKAAHRKVSHCSVCRGWHIDEPDARRILSAHTRRILHRELA